MLGLNFDIETLLPLYWVNFLIISYFLSTYFAMNYRAPFQQNFQCIQYDSSTYWKMPYNPTVYDKCWCPIIASWPIYY